jgi:peptidoglycan/xylan/chitin deacetylase (PgdA/CDA1 family)
MSDSEPVVSRQNPAGVRRRRIPILMYHQVTPHPPPGFRKYSVTPAAFARHMGWLAVAGYVSVGLDALVAHQRGIGRLPARPVVITFDDGYRDCFEYAVPILRRRAFTAIFFLVAGLMGRTSRWLRSERGIELSLMSWEEARDLDNTGFQCGAHSLTHPRLAGLSEASCREELLGARKLLEDRLGHAVEHVAYPFGSFDERVRAMAAEAGYVSGCTVQIGLASPGDDLLSLRRVHVSGEDSLLDFACRLRTGLSVKTLLIGKARGAGRRARRLRSGGRP